MRQKKKPHIMNPINFAHEGSSKLHLPHQMAQANRKVNCERMTTIEKIKMDQSSVLALEWNPTRAKRSNYLSKLDVVPIAEYIQ